MGECVVCGRDVAVSDACPHCARPTCEDHRPPAVHDCRGVDADRTTGWVIDLDGRDGRRTDDAAGDRTTDTGTDPDPDTGTGTDTDTGTGTGGDGDGDGDGVFRALLRPGRWLAVATGLLVVAVLLAAALHTGGATGLDETRAEQLIAREVNEARRTADAGALAYNDTLARVAETHSRNMATGGYVSHESPDGAGLAERYARFGLTCPGGENVYYGPRGGLASSERTLAEQVVRSWLDSPGHRETLLKGRFTAQGIGVVVTDDGGLYVTQDLC